MRAIILTGGIYHDFDRLSAATAGLLAGAGFRSEVVESPAALVASLAQGPAALVVVQALRWRMLGHEKYAPFRADWAYETGPDLIAALQAHRVSGGGLLALHTGCICFDDWPGWQAMLGGGWVWGRSHHAPGLDTVAIRPLPDHPVTAGLGAFTLLDEHYLDLAVDPRAVVLAQGSTAGGPEQPVAWAHEEGGARAVTLTTGHDLASMVHPGQARLVQRAALWAARAGVMAEQQEGVA